MLLSSTILYGNNMKPICRVNLILFIITFFHMASCQSDYNEKLKSLYRNTVPVLSTDSLMNQIKSGGDYYLLDIRSPEEYKVSHIEKAMLIDYDQFKAEDVKDIPLEARVVVYCSVGYRSERIGEKLQDLGFSDVSNIYGGIFQWKNDKYPVVNSDGQPTDSVHTYNRSWSKWLINGIKVY